MDALRPYAEIDVARTERPLHARELAHQAVEDGLDAVIVFAGDGTANEVLNGVAGRLPVGALPAGGTSVLPRAGGSAAAPGARRAPDRRGARRRARPPAAAGRAQRPPLRVQRRRRPRRGHRAAGRRARPRQGASAARRRLRPRGHPRRGLGALRLPEGDAPPRRRGAALRLRRGRQPATRGPTSARSPCDSRRRRANERGLDLVAPVALRRRDVPAYLRYVLFTGGHVRETERRIAYLHDVSEAVVECDRPLPAQVDGDDIGDVRTAHLRARARGHAAARLTRPTYATGRKRPRSDAPSGPKIAARAPTHGRRQS